MRVSAQYFTGKIQQMQLSLHFLNLNRKRKSAKSGQAAEEGPTRSYGTIVDSLLSLKGNKEPLHF